MLNNDSPVLKVSLKLMDQNLKTNLLTSLEPQQERRILRVALYPNPVFNEMWFLTIDSFIRISVFIAKLSERQNCWRVLEDFHSQEYIHLSEVNCSLFIRLHFAMGDYDCRRTTRLRQGIHFRRIQVLFCCSYASTHRS